MPANHVVEPAFAFPWDVYMYSIYARDLLFKMKKYRMYIPVAAEPNVNAQNL
jgi:hypothetical protein